MSVVPTGELRRLAPPCIHDLPAPALPGAHRWTCSICDAQYEWVAHHEAMQYELVERRFWRWSSVDFEPRRVTVPAQWVQSKPGRERWLPAGFASPVVDR